jgi:hypothetical protein
VGVELPLQQQQLPCLSTKQLNGPTSLNAFNGGEGGCSYPVIPIYNLGYPPPFSGVLLAYPAVALEFTRDGFWYLYIGRVLRSECSI